MLVFKCTKARDDQTEAKATLRVRAQDDKEAAARALGQQGKAVVIAVLSNVVAVKRRILIVVVYVV